MDFKCPHCGGELEIELTAGTKKKTKRFVKPTINELKEYAEQIGFPLNDNGFNPQNFIDYYEVRGWIPSGSKVQMKQWKGCVNSWFSNFKRNNPGFVPVKKVSDKEKAKNKAARDNLRKSGHNNDDLFGERQ